MQAAGYGAFGKLPGMGDFFQFDMPAGFVQAWDSWLQRGMLAARERLGADWKTAYFSAPIWRFSLSSGLCGTAPVAGILMCSVDRVGREFPLTILRPLDAARPTGAQHLAMTAEFEALENVALDAMEDETGRDELAHALAGLADGASGAARPGSGSVDTSGARLSIRLGAGADPALAIADALIAERYRGPSIWSALTHGGSRILLYEGMPGDEELAVLMSPERIPHSDA